MPKARHYAALLGRSRSSRDLYSIRGAATLRTTNEALAPLPLERMAATVERERKTSNREVLPDGSVLITGQNVRFRVVVLKPAFMLMVAKGGSRGPEDAAAEAVLLREFELELERSGMLTVFADLRESTRMGGDSREATVAWMRKYQGRINASHVLVRSKLMEMAMSVVAMLVGGGIIKMYSRPQTFLELLRHSAPKLLKIPTL